MASVLLFPDNEGEDKHVESKLIPRLDESSNLSTSTRHGQGIRNSPARVFFKRSSHTGTKSLAGALQALRKAIAGRPAARRRCAHGNTCRKSSDTKSADNR